MMENAARSLVLQNPYLDALRDKGVYLENSYGVMHPSQPNYIATIAGDTFGFNRDDYMWVGPYPTTSDPNSQPPVTTIVDLLEGNGLSWKNYAENFQETDIIQPPVPLFNMVTQDFPALVAKPHPVSDPLFARKHVPFLSFPNIVSNPERAARIVNAQATFEADLAAGNLPNFSWYSPNMVNDGHSLLDSDGNLISGVPGPENMDNVAKFLTGFLGDDPIRRFPPRTLIVVTFDESFPYTGYAVYTLLIGDLLEAGSSRHEPYTHYSLLRSIQDNFELGSQGRNDAPARPYWFLEYQTEGPTTRSMHA